MKKIYPIFLILSLALLSNTAFAQYELLYCGPLANAQDTITMAFFEENGYNVTQVEAGVMLTMATPEAYADYDVLFISEAIGSGSANGYRDAGYPIPCVSTEIWVLNSGNWNWFETADQFLQVPADVTDDGIFTVVMSAEEHYITRWYQEGDEILWTTHTDPAGVGVNGVQLGSTVVGAIELASFNNDGMEPYPTMWAVPEGSAVSHANNDVLVPVNIFLWGIHYAGFPLGGEATPEYFNILLRALQWATDNPSSVEDFSDNMGNDLKIMPNPTSGIVNLSFALNTSGKVQIDIYDITGKRVETIESGYLGAGNNTLSLDFTGKSNGQYIVSLKTNDNVLTRKVLKTQ